MIPSIRRMSQNVMKSNGRETGQDTKGVPASISSGQQQVLKSAMKKPPVRRGSIRPQRPSLIMRSAPQLDGERAVRRRVVSFVEPSKDVASKGSDGDGSVQEEQGNCMRSALIVVNRWVGPNFKDKIQDEGWMQAQLMEMFMAGGHTATFQPGDIILQQDNLSDRIYMLLEGSCVLRKTCHDGTIEDLEGVRGRGDIIGEGSFLLGTPPAASVLATPASFGGTGMPVKTAYLDHQAALAMIEAQPNNMQK